MGFETEREAVGHHRPAVSVAKVDARRRDDGQDALGWQTLIVDNRTYCQEILQRAARQTGAQQVQLAVFDPAAGQARILVSVGPWDRRWFRREVEARALPRGRSRGRDAFEVAPVDANRWQQEVFRAGRAVWVSLEQAARGLWDEGIVRLGRTLTGTRSLYITPLKQPAGVVAALTFHFALEELDSLRRGLCDAYAREMVLMLEKARLSGQVSGVSGRLRESHLTIALWRRLYQITQALAESRDLDEVLASVIRGVQQGLNVDRADLFLVDEKEGVLRGRLGVAPDGRIVRLAKTLPLRSHLYGLIALGKRPYYHSDDVELDVPAAALSGALKSVPASAAVPLRGRGRPVGVLVVDNAASRRPIPKTLLEPLAMLADYAAIAIQNALREKAQRRQQLQAVLIRVQEQRKRELAELLHGRIQTRLLVTWHRLGQCQELLRHDPDRAAALLQQVRDELDDIREWDVREVSHALHPSVISVGLLPALRSLAARFDGDCRVLLEPADAVAAIDRPDKPRIAESVRLACYRIVEEAVANACRHARAPEVTVQVDLPDPEHLEVTIRDDGCGFDPQHVRHGLGMETMAARAVHVGGQLQVESAPGAGTTVRARLPLKGKAPDSLRL